jgi:hypothetical protein
MRVTTECASKKTSLNLDIKVGQTGHTGTARSRMEKLPSGQIMLEGELSVPVGASGVVLFAHGSGSSRHSPRNQFVARTIREAGVGTLLFDLFTPRGRSRRHKHAANSWRPGLNPVIRMNEDAYRQLHCEKELRIVPGRRICLKNRAH